jgi:thiamine transport system substrate-binding protein
MRILLFLLVISLASLPVCAQDVRIPLRVLTHDSFVLDEDLLVQFERAFSVDVIFLRAGDGGQIVNQAILTRNNPLADVLVGIDNTFLGRALEAGLFAVYVSPESEHVNPDLWVEPDGFVTPIDYGDVCINYDIGYFDENDIVVPADMRALATPEYASLLVTMNPATSSPGLAFLLATIDTFGEEGGYTYLDFWTELVQNGARIEESWTQAYFGLFSAVSETGQRPMVVSYASSPPFTVNPDTGEAATASILADGMCYRQIEFAGVLYGAEQPEIAGHFIDFLLSEPVQRAMPTLNFVFPAREEVDLDEDWLRFAPLPETPVLLEVNAVEANLEGWIEAWMQTVYGG